MEGKFRVTTQLHIESSRETAWATFAALCGIFDCSPHDLFEPYVELRAATRPPQTRHAHGTWG